MKRVSPIVVIIVLINMIPLYSARPFATDDAGTVTQGEFELETGSEFWEDILNFGLGFKHGLTDRMDVGLGFGYTMRPENVKGLGPYEIAFKFVLLPEHAAVSMTGYPGDLAYDLNGIVTYCTGPIEVDMNLGYAATGIQDQEGDVIYGAALIIDLAPVDIGAEVSGFDGELDSWLIGGRYSILEGLAVDCGFAGGFDAASENIITVGLHYEF